MYSFVVSVYACSINTFVKMMTYRYLQLKRPFRHQGAASPPFKLKPKDALPVTSRLHSMPMEYIL